MIAFHYLTESMKAGCGREPAWTLGEDRTIKSKKPLVLCQRGYHSSPTAWDGLPYAPGPILCVVEISEPEGMDVTEHEAKYVSRTRKLVAFVNIEKELRQFAIDCAERALLREREHGREPDARFWAAIEAAKAFLRGEITPEELAAAYTATYASAYACASVSAYVATAAYASATAAYATAYASAAYAAATAAYASAARDAARDAERQWQRDHFNSLVQPRIDAMLEVGV